MSGSSEELPLPPDDAGQPKLQRWVDLVSALLARRRPVTFDDLAPSIPAYEWPPIDGAALTAEQQAANKQRRDSTKRTFERDKDELRAFGIPIDTDTDGSGNSDGAYLLQRKDFYLPFLALVAPGAGSERLTRLPHASAAQRSRDTAGSTYGTLAMLGVEPDELQMIVDAAACARELGDDTLALEATRALRKLAFDLPVGSTDGQSATPTVQADAAQHDAATFQALATAVQRRKAVTIVYHAMERDEERERRIDPWGLFFLSGHWYCVARDHEADALRNFRLNRIRRARPNTSRPQTPDFTVPATFRLREHARSKEAWELGDDTPLEVIVRLRATTGESERRTFAVRREAPFIRWLLAFAGDAVPESPPSIVAAWQQALGRVSESLDRADASAAELGDRLASWPAPAPKPVPRPPRITDTALAQIRRLLEMLPHLASGDDVPIAELERRTGLPYETLRDDVYALMVRSGDPAGFVEGVQLYLTSEHVSAVTHAFRRPMRLVATEVCAIRLGLSVLAHLRPPDERECIARARERVDAVMAAIGNDPLLEGIAATLHDGGSLNTLYVVRTAIEARQVLRIAYRKPDAAAESRDIEPYALVSSGARLYVIAHCRRAGELRLFRIDRMESAVATGEPFAIPGDFTVDQVLARGKAFMQGTHDLLVVRYAPAIARWIAEREGVLCDADGSLTMAHPLADSAWAIRHVLQYAGDAELLAPPTLRAAMRERVARLRASA